MHLEDVDPATQAFYDSYSTASDHSCSPCHGHLTSLQLACILKPAQMTLMACRCSKPAPMHLEDVEPPLPAECVAIWQARCANQPPPQLPSRRRPALPPPGQQDHLNPPAASQ